MHLSLFDETALRFYDAGSAGYVGFKAPALVTTPVTWTLPDADGTPNQVLSTDGTGNLVWVSVLTGISISTGVTNAFAYYNSSTSIDNSPLLIPAGLPGVNGTGLVVDTSGQVTYQMLVEPAGVAGRLAYYTAAQTVGHSALLFFDDTLKFLELNDETELRFFEDTAFGTNYVGLRAPSNLGLSYSVTLPPVAPLPDQQMTAVSATEITFAYADLAKTREQRGYVTVPDGASSVTVMFEAPFATVPQSIQTQWSIEGLTGVSTLPTTGVRLVQTDGFVLKLSTTTTQAYRLYWEAYLVGYTTSLFNAYFAGGDDSGFQNFIYALNLDVDTSAITSPGTLSSARAYTASSSSPSTGYIYGGEVGVVSSAIISSFVYATSSLSDLGPVLSVARSGATGVGNKLSGYIAGGETIGSSTLLTLDKMEHATETVSTIAATLSSPALKRGSAQSSSTGLIVHSTATSTTEKLDFGSDTLSAGTAIGVTLIQVGCNDLVNNVAYLGRFNGDIYSYDLNTDTVSSTGVTVTSTTDLSASFNSMLNGYFSGDSAIDRFDFTTQTASPVTSLPYTAAAGASISTFQTNGLL